MPIWVQMRPCSHHTPPGYFSSCLYALTQTLVGYPAVPLYGLSPLGTVPSHKPCLQCPPKLGCFLAQETKAKSSASSKLSRQQQPWLPPRTAHESHIGMFRAEMQIMPFGRTTLLPFVTRA